MALDREEQERRERGWRQVGSKPLVSGTCAVCSCTEEKPCTSMGGSVACSWTDGSKTLCTACVAARNRHKEREAYTRKIG